jgi:hypothetical protein
MSILWTIIIGFVAGIIAKLIYKGADPENQRLCLRPPYAPLSWAAIVGLSNRQARCPPPPRGERSVRPKKHIPVGPQLKQPSRLGFHTNCNNVADL